MKYEYIHSGIDWIGEIPKHWGIDRLKDIVELRNEKTNEKSEIEDYLELEDIEKDTGRVISFRNTTEVTSKVTLFKKGDVLFGKLRPYLNKHYLALEGGKCTGEILAFNCTKVHNGYFNYFISSPSIIETCNVISYGAKMPRVDYTTQLAYFEVSLPPLAEQIAIANYLDKACADIDRVVEIKRKQIENLQQQLKSIIHHTVTKGLNPNAEMKDSGIDWIGKVPKHWSKEKIFRAAEFVTSGGTPKSGNEEYYLDGDIYWIQSGDLNDGYVTETEKKITQGGLNNSSAKLFPKDTLLVAMYGATIGKIGIQTMEAATNQACCAIFPVKRIALRCLYYFFLAIRDKYISDAYGGGQPNISQSLIKQTYFFVPNKKEQVEIYEFLDNELNKVETVRNKIEKQIETILTYKKSLIHEVVTGKKQVSEL